MKHILSIFGGFALLAFVLAFPPGAHAGESMHNADAKTALFNDTIDTTPAQAAGPAAKMALTARTSFGGEHTISMHKVYPTAAKKIVGNMHQTTPGAFAHIDPGRRNI